MSGPPPAQRGPDMSSAQGMSAVPQLGAPLEQLATRGDERPVAALSRAPGAQRRHAVAIQESQLEQLV